MTLDRRHFLLVHRSQLAESRVLDGLIGRDLGKGHTLLSIDVSKHPRGTRLSRLEPRAMVEKLPQSNGENEIPKDGVLYASQEQGSRLLVGHGKQKAAKGAEHN